MAESCPNCGHSLPDDFIQVKPHGHNLSSGLVSTLSKFAHAVIESGKNNVHLTYDMLDPHLKLTHNEHANFQKLRFFGLVAKVRDSEGKHIPGRWLLTRRGSQFLKGLESVPRRVITKKNRIDARPLETVHISAFRGKTPEFQTNFEIIEGNVLIH